MDMQDTHILVKRFGQKWVGSKTCAKVIDEGKVDHPGIA